MSSVNIVLYGGLSNSQITSLTHETNKESLYAQAKESLRVFFYRSVFALTSGKYFTNKSLAEHLVTCYLTDNIKSVEVRSANEQGCSFELNIVDLLFKKVISQIHSQKTRETLKDYFRQKKTRDQKLTEDLAKGNMKISFWNDGRE